MIHENKLKRPCPHTGELHKFDHVVGEDPSIKVELCEWCGDEFRVKLDRAGKIVNIEAYMEAHLLDHLQPYHKQWHKYYGQFKQAENARKQRGGELQVDR